MMSPRFHSASFLVHLSGFGVAIRRGCRHFSFFCVSTQLVMLYVSICSSASSVILFPCSFQSSTLSSWLAVLSSSSSSNEILLSWSYSSCVLSSSRVSSLISSSRMFFFGWQRNEGCQCMANVTTLGCTQRTVIGQERGGQDPSKKGKENDENRCTSSVRQRCAQRRRLAQEIIPSTFSQVKQLP